MNKRWLQNVFYAVALWQFFGYILKEERSQKTTQDTPLQSAPNDQRLEFKDGANSIWLKPSEIAYIEAARNYLVIHTTDSSPVVRASIKSLEQRLFGFGFLRISRSALVNVDAVKVLEKYSKNSMQVVLIGGQTLNVGRTYLERVRKTLRTDHTVVP